MKKTLVALAALAATGAFAQSSVTLSGDLSFGHLVNTARTTSAAATKTTAIGPIDSTNANRINVTAVEDLGGGLKATGRVDNRLSTANAARGTGDMYIQVDGGFGSVRVGQYTFASHASWNAGLARTVSSTSTAAQSLSTSVISYTSPSFSGLTVAAAIDLDGSTNAAGRDGWGLKLNYAAGPLAAQASYTTAVRVDGKTPVTVFGLAASYDFGVAKVFYNQTDSRAGNNATAITTTGYLASGTAAGAGTIAAHSGNSLSVTVPLGAATLRAGMVNRKGDTNATIIDRSALGVDYALSKRTTLVAEFGQDKQAVTGANRATNSFVGVNHTF